MTGMNNGVDWRRVLERADEQAAVDPDPIGVMVAAVEERLQRSTAGGVDFDVSNTHDGVRAELDRSLHECSRLADELEAARREVEQSSEQMRELRGEVHRLQDLDARQRRVLHQLGEESARRTDTSPAEHRHAYPLDEPDDLPGTCECGHPFPRILVEEDEVVPELSGWDQLWEQIRAEAAEWGWDPRSPDGDEVEAIARRGDVS